MSGHRRAALALHGLKAQDKEWLLTQLPGQDQAILREHLQELDTLGFRFEPGLMEQLPGVDNIADGFDVPPSATAKADPAKAAFAKAASSGALADPLAAAMEAIAGATAEQILLLVQDEPVAWLARLLACHDWPWQAALLAQLPATTRQRLRGLSPLPAKKLDQSLLLALQRALADAPAPLPQRSPVPQQRGRFWTKWWRR